MAASSNHSGWSVDEERTFIPSRDQQLSRDQQPSRSSNVSGYGTGHSAADRISQSHERSNQKLSHTEDNQRDESILRIDFQEPLGVDLIANYADKFYDLAMKWFDKKTRQHSPPSFPASDLQKEHPRKDQPQSYQRQSSPDVVFVQEHIPKLHDYRRPESGDPVVSKSQHNICRSSLTRPISKNYHRSRPESTNSCHSSSKCCHHTTIYQYGCPPEYRFNPHNDHRRVKEFSVENDDRRILENLGGMRNAVTVTKKVASKGATFYDDADYLPTDLNKRRVKCN